MCLSLYITDERRVIHTIADLCEWLGGTEGIVLHERHTMPETEVTSYFAGRCCLCPVDVPATMAARGYEVDHDVFEWTATRTPPPEGAREMTETIEGLTFTMTCGACPEQYDVHLDGRQVGYLRLRHGYFSVEVPDSGGETVYEAEPDGDGCFEEHERAGYLVAAALAIKARLTGPALRALAESGK